jgi:hypothetical protein
MSIIREVLVRVLEDEMALYRQPGHRFDNRYAALALVTEINRSEPEAGDDVFMVAQADEDNFVGETIHGSSLSAPASRSAVPPGLVLGVCQPRQQPALRPAAADGLGAQSRSVAHRQANDAAPRGAAIAKGQYRRRDSDPLR